MVMNESSKRLPLLKVIMATLGDPLLRRQVSTPELPCLPAAQSNSAVTYCSRSDVLRLAESTMMHTFHDTQSEQSFRLTLLDNHALHEPFVFRSERWNPETRRYEVILQRTYKDAAERQEVFNKQMNLIRSFFPTFREKIDSINSGSLL